MTDTNLSYQSLINDKNLVGADLLSSLSDGLYGNPLEIYREFVQNATDAYEQADGSEKSRIIEIDVDRSARTSRFRDFALGMSPEEMATNLLSIGKSEKKGSHLRGFRGIGRLAALGYCKRLVFRSRQNRANKVIELSWDCLSLQDTLAYQQSSDIQSIIHSVTTFTSLNSSEDYPDCFFECVLEGIKYTHNDMLLNPFAIATYLCETGPVPFDNEFSFRHQIEEILKPVNPFVVRIHINENPVPLSRPHRDYILKADGSVVSTIRGVKEITPMDIACFSEESRIAGWVLEHDLPGALPLSAQVRGLRTRIGNLQIGDEQVWDCLFYEARFNLWHIGEIHIQTDSIRPNTRRDALTPSPVLDNITNSLNTVAGELSDVCRKASQERNRAKKTTQKQVILGREKYNKILSQLDVSSPYPERIVLSMNSEEEQKNEL